MKNIILTLIALLSVNVIKAQETEYLTQDITATIPYNGQYGSATLLMDLANPTLGIRNPLIVVEGFDPGVLIDPESKYGYTDIDNFIQIINNSGSGELRSILDFNQQYDIIYVDWKNGVDHIQRNAYCLQAVIKWVNDQKTLNGSTASNVVLGQSMGGLIARFALKNMEDTGLPTQTSLYISHDAPHLGANIPVGYQYFSRHALHQYVKTPLAFAGGEVILPLFTDGVTPLDYLLLQDTPAAKQMLINYLNVNYSINNSVHSTWQNELKAKGYPSMRKIAISNGNHCAIPQNAPAGTQLLSVDGNYSTGWATDIILSAFPGINVGIFKTLALFTNEPGFLWGILPGGNKIKLDFKVNSLPSSGTNQIYKGKITYTKKLLYLININVTITDQRFNSPSSLPFDYYPGGTFDTGIRNSSSQSPSGFWREAFYKYKMAINTEPTFSFVPTTSALDIGRGNVTLNNNDYLTRYNSRTPPATPKDSPFNNFITSFQDSFFVSSEDFYSSTNEHHIFLHRRNGNWLATELNNNPNDNQTFDCSFRCSNEISISGSELLCPSLPKTYSVPNVATNYSWSTSNDSIVTISGNGTNTITLTVTNPTFVGDITLFLGLGNNICGFGTITKTIHIGAPTLPGDRYIGGDNWIPNTYPGLVAAGVHPAPLATSYEWNIYREDDRSCPSTATLPRFPDENRNTYSTNSPSVDIRWGNCIGQYRLTCDAVNECGGSRYLEKYVQVGYPKDNPCVKDNPQTMKISPNPVVNGSITVNFENIDEASYPCTYDPENHDPYNNATTVNIKIFDLQGNEVFVKAYEYAETLTIPGIDLKPGYYALNAILSNGKTYQEIVIVL